MAWQSDSVFSAMHEASFRTSTDRKLLLANFHAVPKRHIVFDGLGGLFGFGIKPCGIGINFSADVNVVITGEPLPRAGRMRLTSVKEIFLDRIRWKVMVAFDHLGVSRLSQHGVFPDRFHDVISPGF